jgi:hypothetical protein
MWPKLAAFSVVIWATGPRLPTFIILEVRLAERSVRQIGWLSHCAQSTIKATQAFTVWVTASFMFATG